MKRGKTTTSKNKLAKVFKEVYGKDRKQSQKEAHHLFKLYSKRNKARIRGKGF